MKIAANVSQFARVRFGSCLVFIARGFCCVSRVAFVQKARRYILAPHLAVFPLVHAAVLRSNVLHCMDIADMIAESCVGVW